jgi:hypothetical protein
MMDKRRLLIIIEIPVGRYISKDDPREEAEDLLTADQEYSMPGELIAARWLPEDFRRNADLVVMDEKLTYTPLYDDEESAMPLDQAIRRAQEIQDERLKAFYGGMYNQILNGPDEESL